MNFPSEIMPLAILRPISGSSSIAIATDIMKNFGVDSQIGIMSAVIMGATETTLYTIAVYSSSVKIKKTRFVLIASLIADIVGIITSIIVCRIIAWFLMFLGTEKESSLYLKFFLNFVVTFACRFLSRSFSWQLFTYDV